MKAVQCLTGTRISCGNASLPPRPHVPGTARRCTRLKQPLVCQADSDSATRQLDDDVDLAWLLPRQTVAMAASGAVLGPLLDGLHSSNNVLHYHDPSFLRLGPWQLETCWWVPPLFGVAGIIIGVGVPLLDYLLPRTDSPAPDNTASWQAPSAQAPPSWFAVMLCIALFVSQYGLSGSISAPLQDVKVLGVLPATDTILAAYAAVHFAVFERGTVAGLALSLATFVCGPLVEVALINGFHLYHYEQPDVWGIPLWIAWVYFCGGPAVGNLGRVVWHTLLDAQRLRQSASK